MLRICGLTDTSLVVLASRRPPPRSCPWIIGTSGASRSRRELIEGARDSDRTPGLYVDHVHIDGECVEDASQVVGIAGQHPVTSAGQRRNVRIDHVRASSSPE